MPSQLSWAAASADSLPARRQWWVRCVLGRLSPMRHLQELLSLCLPRPCPVCAGPEGPHAAGICGRCRPGLGQALMRVRAPPGVDEAWALGTYDAPLGGLVRQAKFGADPVLADAIGRWMGTAAAGLPRVDLVVPVSSPWWRTLRRGQDLPRRLARPVALSLGAPLSCVLRHGGRMPQRGRDRAGRLAIDVDQFSVRCATPGRVLVIDDVQTTGATLSACAGALRRQGAAWVGTCAAVVQPHKNVKKSLRIVCYNRFYQSCNCLV